MCFTMQHIDVIASIIGVVPPPCGSLMDPLTRRHCEVCTRTDAPAGPAPQQHRGPQTATYCYYERVPYEIRRNPVVVLRVIDVVYCQSCMYCRTLFQQSMCVKTTKR